MTTVRVSKSLLKQWPILAWSRLSPAQYKLACVASRGVSLKAIAVQKGVSPVSIRRQMLEVYRKLGLKGGQLELIVHTWGSL
jgi:DNA-binding CsgD family transcriptional regulator